MSKEVAPTRSLTPEEMEAAVNAWIKQQDSEGWVNVEAGPIIFNPIQVISFARSWMKEQGVADAETVGIDPVTTLLLVAKLLLPEAGEPPKTITIKVN